MINDKNIYNINNIDRSTNDIILWRKLLKKIKGTPLPMQILQRRTMSSAIGILESLEGVSFDRISRSLYFYCQDLRMNQFTGQYEAQVELAGANSEKFALGLHKFYNDMANQIKRYSLYDEYFEFYYRCNRIRLENDDKNIEDKVIVSYLNLLIQQMEYLKPDKFNFHVTVCGRKTTGELMVAEDPFYNIDQPSNKIHDLVAMGKSLDKINIREMYKKYGYNIVTSFDLEVLSNIDRIQSTTTIVLSPFINEYTYDIHPTFPYSGRADVMSYLISKISLDQIKTELTRRKRTLPFNGVTVTFQRNEMFKSLLLREVYYDNTIFMLYKLTTDQGDLAGFYDTKGKFMNIALREYKADLSIADRVASLVLYCYASFVLNKPEYNLKQMGETFFYDFEPLEADGYIRGGKPKKTYNPDNINSKGQSRINNDNYQSEERHISEFIRKLPEGHHASKEAIDLAESLGYELEDNETFVRPFTKQVYKLKYKEKYKGENNESSI